MAEGKRFKDLLALLGSLRGDLANVTAPPTFQAPSSAVELPICWAQRPSVFLAPALETDPLKRHLRVLEWIIYALKAQYYLGLDERGSARKPLNAFLGEVFSADWTDEAGTVNLISEQVSHHPPITAAHVSSEAHGISASGYTRVEMSFNGSFNVKQTGHIIMHIDKYNEDHLLPFPSNKMKGFLARKLFPEISGTHHIVSSTGFISEITFSGEGIFTDLRKRNRIAAKVYRASDTSKTPLYTVSGQWNKEFTVSNAQDKKDTVTHYIDRPIPPIQIPELSEQDPWESRRAWGAVIDSIRKQDIWKLLREKTKLEEAQRAIRRKEAAEGIVWEQKFFTSHPDDPIFQKLAAKVGWKLEADRTKGVWLFDREKARRATKPYRGQETPFGDVPSA